MKFSPELCHLSVGRDTEVCDTGRCQWEAVKTWEQHVKVGVTFETLSMLATL